MDPQSILQYEVIPQLEAFTDDGVQRLLGAFADIETEADRVAQDAFEAYGRRPGEGHMGDFADLAQDEGISYYQTLAELKQAVTNLLAVGLYHLFEQHYAAVRHAVGSGPGALPERADLSRWPRIDELRLLANAAKHADGSSAEQLRARRPDYFVDPMLRSTRLKKWAQERPRPLRNPLGGTDLFVARCDLDDYRDALRQFWESLLPTF